jgi:TPP-dependent pyruvate/acetoin dehydrogenase alpha subunit
MTTRPDEHLARDLAREVLRLRFSQMFVNQANKAKQFKCPIHLALGHEAIAVAVAAVLKDGDWLLATHRNIHYNLARSPCLKTKMDEYLGKDSGEAHGQLGCMNLYNEQAGILYTSSILGNQMGVAAGVALANRVSQRGGVAAVVIGDGAIEEGIFYESMVMMKTFRCSALVIVENNHWSLATEIQERRCDIKLDLWGASLGIPYYQLKGNDVYHYIERLQEAYARALTDESPVIVEVALHTLGDWRMKTDEYPNGKYINYHAGAAPNVELSENPVIEASDDDPTHVLKRRFGTETWELMSRNVLAGLREELQ